MEQAAQTSSDPQHIKESRHRHASPLRTPTNCGSPFSESALLVLLGVHFFLNWQHAFISESALPEFAITCAAQHWSQASFWWRAYWKSSPSAAWAAR